MSHDASYHYNKRVRFRTFDSGADADLVIEFGRDLYRESTGSLLSFQRDYGRDGDGFPRWLGKCAKSNSTFCRLLAEDQHTVGLVALGLAPDDASIGHVYHFYIAPTHRGRGFGGLLDDYARDALRDAKCERARLNVTPSNTRAIRFYEAQGWRSISRRSRGYGLRWFEISL